jgi:hypothetical protein
MLKNLNRPPDHIYLYATPFDFNELKLSVVQKLVLKIITAYQSDFDELVALATMIINNHQYMTLLYKFFYPFMDKHTRNYEIAQWKTQKPQLLIESIVDLVSKSLLNENTSSIPLTYIASKHDNYLNIDLTKKHVKKVFPNASFVLTEKMKHVPQGPLTDEFFQPVIDTVNS